MSKPVRVKLTKEQLLLGEKRPAGFEIDIAEHEAARLVGKRLAAYVQTPAPSAPVQKNRAE